MITRNRFAVVVVLAVLAIAGPALAQVPQNDAPGYTVTVDAPGSATRCQEIEVVLDINAQPGGGTESVKVEFGGMKFSRSYCEKLEWWPGPDHSCNVENGIEHWGGSNAYRGKIHAFFIVTASPPAQAYVQARYGAHNNLTFASAASFVSVAGLGGAVNVNVASLPKSIPADGASMATIRVSCLDASCNGLGYRLGTLSTSKGTLSADSNGASVTFSTDGWGVGSATLTADTTPGTATVTASVGGGSGSATVDMTGETLTLTSGKQKLPADHYYTTIITATVKDTNGQPVANEDVDFSTDVSGFDSPSSAPTPTTKVKTDASGVARATYVSTAVTETTSATITATHGTQSAQVTLELVCFFLWVDKIKTTYRSVPGFAYDSTQDVENTAFSQPMTMHGTTEMEFLATLLWDTSVVADLPTLDGSLIEISSGQIVDGGPFYFTDDNDITQTEIWVATDSKGEARFLLTGKGLYDAGITSEITLTVKAKLLFVDATVEATSEVDVIDNVAAIVEDFQEMALGPIWQDTYVEELRTRLTSHAFDAMMAARDSGHAGWVNNVLAHGSLAPVIGDLSIDFFKYGDAPAQRIILRHLAQLQAGSIGDAPRWLLNGLDYDPILAHGVQNVHQFAVLLHGRLAPGEGPGAESRLFDYWVHQKPEVFTGNEWVATRTADRSSYVHVGFTFPDYAEGFYPGDSGPYPTADAVPVPADTLAYYNAHARVDCPVYVTLEDNQGHVSGYDPRPGGTGFPTADEVPGAAWSVVGHTDGTLAWGFDLPSTPTTLTVRAYGSGTLTLSVVANALGKILSYASVSITENDTATLSYDPSAATLPALEFADGRRIEPTAAPVGQPAVSPSKGVSQGGTSVTVTGFDVAAGAMVTVGGAAATQVTYVNGTTLTAVTGRAMRVGPVDVVVTNPGAAPVTLVKAFTYETPSGLVDLNADGLGDIVFYQPDSGRSAMTMADGQGGFAATLGQWSPDWTIRAGDFNGDGATDLFFYNGVTGAWYVGVNDGQGTYQYLPGQWAAGWTVEVLDLNADTQADVFVYNEATGAWYQCLTTTPGTFTYHAGQWAPGWGVWAGDFDGNGAGDVFVYNRATGSWYECLSDAVGGFSYVAGQWSPGWEVSVGDLNGDGRSDVFVYNAATGAWYVCLTTDGGFVYTPGSWLAGWQVSVGDFDADGMADVFVYNPVSGFWYVCQSDGAGGFVPAGGQWDPAWEVHVTDLNGDAQADVLVYNPATGRYYQCVTTGLGTFAYTAGQWDPGWTLITAAGR